MERSLTRAEPLRCGSASAPYILAASVWVSLNPYFLWGIGAAAMILAGMVAGVIALIGFAANRYRVQADVEMIGVGLMTIFLLYITALPKADGGHIKWVFILPSLWALWLLSDDQRRRCIDFFATIFALSLVLGIVISFCLVAGMSITFKSIPVPNTLMATEGSAQMFLFPGALFIKGNGIVLPWGGVLFRLCGIYDEPGTVGTIGALLLASNGFRLSGWRPLLIYLAGLLAFSLAFVVLATIGFLGRAAIKRSRWPLIAILPIAVAATLILGLWSASIPAPAQTKVAIEGSLGVLSNQLVTSSAGGHPTLRQVEQIDNRSQPQMNFLVHEYLHSGATTLPVWHSQRCERTEGRRELYLDPYTDGQRYRWDAHFGLQFRPDRTGNLAKVAVLGAGSSVLRFVWVQRVPAAYHLDALRPAIHDL